MKSVFFRLALPPPGFHAAKWGTTGAALMVRIFSGNVPYRPIWSEVGRDATRITEAGDTRCTKSGHFCILLATCNMLIIVCVSIFGIRHNIET